MVLIKKRILVLVFSELSKDPRVYRQLSFLTSQGKYEIAAVGFDSANIDNVEYINIIQCSKKSAIKRLINVINLKTNRYEKYYWSSIEVDSVRERLSGRHFDLIIANDLNTLPLALYLADGNNSKVILDAHEYQPRQFDDRWLFRFFFQDYWDYICRTYLPRVDSMLTVCPGIAEEYTKVYGIKCDVLTNAPFYESLQPSKIDEKNIRMIYHGFLNSSRKIENMIYLMDSLDERFTLDLMVISNQSGYLEKIQKLVESRSNIKFREPVPMTQISKILNEYDIGLFLLWPASFNYRLALPNKLFEYIQGRLAVAIWPSPEMARLVSQYSCGIISEDFSIESIANSINRLTIEELCQYKNNSEIAASEVCAESNLKVFETILGGLI